MNNKIKKILSTITVIGILSFCTGCDDGAARNQIHKAVVVNKIYKPKRTEGHFHPRQYGEEYYLQLRPLPDDGTMIYRYSIVEVSSYDYNSCQLGDTIKFSE